MSGTFDDTFDVIFYQVHLIISHKRAGFIPLINILVKTGFDNSIMSRMCVHVLLLVYTWLWTCLCLHISSFFSLLFFKVFKVFLILIILCCLKTYCYIFNLSLLSFSLKETDSLLFRFVLAKSYFSIFHTTFNKYFSLPQSTYQFRVSVRKWAVTVMHMHVIFVIL